MCTNVSTKKGVTSIEVVLGVAIAGIVLAYTMSAVGLFVNTAHSVSVHTQALYLASDGLELTRFIRDKSWVTFNAIPINTTRYITVSATSTSITTTPEVIGDFTRSFVISNVYRNTSTDDIVASTTGGSVADTETKYITVTVGWGVGGDSVSLTTILANIEP